MRLVFVSCMCIMSILCLNNLVYAGFFDSLEQDVGASSHGQIVSDLGGLYDDPEMAGYVDAVGQRIVQVSDRQDIQYRFYILNHKVVNAMAVPGGYVYITRGMLQKLENEAQLAAVLGHELAHITKKHGMDNVKKAMGFQVLLIGLTSFMGGSKKSRRAAQIAAIAGSIGFNFAML